MYSLHIFFQKPLDKTQKKYRDKKPSIPYYRAIALVFPLLPFLPLSSSSFKSLATGYYPCKQYSGFILSVWEMFSTWNSHFLGKQCQLAINFMQKLVYSLWLSMLMTTVYHTELSVIVCWHTLYMSVIPSSLGKVVRSKKSEMDVVVGWP